MQLSPVQLLEAYLVKVSVDINQSYDSSLELKEHELALEHMAHISFIAPDDDKEENSEPAERHYSVVLGIRSDVEKSESLPYTFEIVVTALISIQRSQRKEEAEIDDMAVKYGYSMLYGQIRERLSGLTSRMRRGEFLLPTMSFMDETFPRDDSPSLPE